MDHCNTLPESNNFKPLQIGWIQFPVMPHKNFPAKFSKNTWRPWMSAFKIVAPQKKEGTNKAWFKIATAIQCYTSWWFQPIWKILVKMEIFPK